MVFHCRCFSFSFEEDEEIEHVSRAQTLSTSTPTFYTASSVLSNLPEKSKIPRGFSIDELKEATNNFSSARKIGEGRYGSVYKGVVNSLEHPFDQIRIAVKYTKGATKGRIDWLTEFIFFGMVEHPNLVKLVGYCVQPDDEQGTERLVVHEYMPDGSVRGHLSAKSETETTLSWAKRLKVAQDAARGLAYLHEKMDSHSQSFFTDFNSSKLLLDDEWNTKVSDLGVAQESDTDDVWSYGVLLYELITGRQPLDTSRPQNEQKLLEWVRPYVHSKNLQPIIDPRLEGMHSLMSVEALATIADLCLDSRPNMRKVLKMVNRLIEVPLQVTSPGPSPKSPVPVIRRSKLFKSWFRNVFCCVCIAVSK